MPRIVIIKLFVRRVFIIDDCDELGVVDSEDLLLIISRETLQEKNLSCDQKKTGEYVPGHGCCNRWKEARSAEQSGKCLKLGFHEDPTNGSKIAELLRFNTCMWRVE